MSAKRAGDWAKKGEGLYIESTLFMTRSNLSPQSSGKPAEGGRKSGGDRGTGGHQENEALKKTEQSSHELTQTEVANTWTSQVLDRSSAHVL